MRIGCVTNNIPCKEQPFRGHSTYQTLLALQKYAQVDVISPQARYPRFLLPRSRGWARTDDSYCVPGLQVKYVEYPAVPVLSRRVNGYNCMRAVEPDIVRGNYDVILNYWLYPDGYAAAMIGRKYGIPTILKAMGSDVNRVSGISRRFTMEAMQASTLVTSVSDALSESIVSMGIAREKVRTIKNGCDTSVFHPRNKLDMRHELGLSENAKYFVYVGRYDLKKGLLELISAVAALKHELPELQLLLVGDGSARATLHTHAEQLGVMDRVEMLGPFATDEIAKWVAASDVFALPSYAEGLPNAVIEALSCGRPVVASAVGGVPELVDSESGVLIPPKRVDALTDALRTALTRSWDEAAIARKHLRSWDNVAIEVMQLCQQYAGKRVGEFAATTR